MDGFDLDKFKEEVKALEIQEAEANLLLRERGASFPTFFPSLIDELTHDEASAPWSRKNALDRLEEFLREFVILKSDVHYWALTLWIVYAHAVGEFDFSPRLAIWSPEKRCGKSLLLEIISLLVPSARMTSSISPSALFRLAERDENTVFLIDESDTVFGRNGDRERAEALRGLLNSGFKRGLVVTRCEPPKFDPKDFHVFAPVALAGIGTNSIPETVADRSIVIEMRRKFPHETIREFQSDEIELLFDPIRESVATYVKIRGKEFRGLRPELPKELNPRARDIWRPFFKIAHTAGEEWIRRVTVASTSLSSGEADSDDSSLPLRLLGDIRNIFDGERMSSKELMHALEEIEEAPWGKGTIHLNTHYLARMLRNYGVKPRPFSGGKVRGYFRKDLEEPWTLYLDPSHTRESVTTVTSVTSEESMNAQALLQESLEATYLDS